MDWSSDKSGERGVPSRGRSDSIAIPGERPTEAVKEEAGQNAQLPEESRPAAIVPSGNEQPQYTELQDRRYSCETIQTDASAAMAAAAPKYNPRNTVPVQRANSTGKSQTKPALEPPVTKSTLSELDVNKIVHNPKLRHDINFDPELHFRPNLDGEKGRRKTEKANAFWSRMCRELEVFATDGPAFEAEFGEGEWCLPATLRAIRGILETLVPARDRASVEEIFNVEMLMQQFTRGVADLEKLANWLSQLLKSHCAPMRDEWVDEMVSQLSNGDRNHDIPLLVGGMRTLLGVLEAMKLDVANHQIRCLRPLLIEDTVQFEQKFFMKKIALRRLDVVGAHTWFREANRVHASSVPQPQGDMGVFFKALVNLVLPSQRQNQVPHTFLFDEERIVKLRTDVFDVINMEICARQSQALHTRSNDFSSSTFNDSHRYSSPTVPSSSYVRSRASPYPYLTRSANSSNSSLASTSSAHSSPVFSPVHRSPTSSPPPTQQVQPPSPNALRATLLAVLSEAPPDTRWTTELGAVALQLLRTSPRPLSDLPQFEAELSSHINTPSSPLFQAVEADVSQALHSMLMELVSGYTPLTSLQLFESATSPRSAPYSQLAAQNTLHDIATRCAHIGILHWRVWAPLAYLVNPEADESTNPNSRGAGADTTMVDRDSVHSRQANGSSPHQSHHQQRQSTNQIETRTC